MATRTTADRRARARRLEHIVIECVSPELDAGRHAVVDGRRALEVDIGFDPHGLVVARVNPLAARYPNFVLRAEGKTRVNTVPAYQVIFTATVDGQTMFGRDVFLFAQGPHVRRGVEITMLTTPTASRQVSSPLEVASEGVLLRPLKTFALH